MAADRAQHVAEVVGPALDEGRWVVTERFSGSTLAYQGYGRGLDLDELRGWWTGRRAASARTSRSSSTSPSTLAREPARPEPGRPTGATRRRFHERVRAGYRALAAAEPDTWVVVDATGRSMPSPGSCWRRWSNDSGRCPPHGPHEHSRRRPRSDPPQPVRRRRRPGRCRRAAAGGGPSTGARLSPGRGRPVWASAPLVRGFAAALLCPHGGAGTCEVCRRALAGVHPDVVEVERTGALRQRRRCPAGGALAQRRPLEAQRQVIVVSDIHVARLAAPVLLKTLEEPAGQTVFVLLADAVPAELATVASRCVRIELALRCHRRRCGEWLTCDGDRRRARRRAGRGGGGSIDRARLLADDAGFADRRPLWRSVPTAPRRHRGGGGERWRRSCCPRPKKPWNRCGRGIGPRWRDSVPSAEQRGERTVPRRKEIEDRQTARNGGGGPTNCGPGSRCSPAAYRDRLVTLAAPDSVPRHGRGEPPSGCGEARRRHHRGGAISAAELIRNPNESLLLEAMLVRLSAVTA